MTNQMRVRFLNYTDGILNSETLTHEPVNILCRESQRVELDSLSEYITVENIFNIVNFFRMDDGRYEAELIVLEPDYLIDISSLSECFKPYGNHPLNYMLGRFRIPENTRHILLGNTANFFIDALVNDHDADYASVLKKLFKISPFEFTACEDLQDPKMEKEFFKACHVQFANIRYILEQKFPQENINPEKIVLEPSFICNTLGLQGRLDIMLQDYTAFVELKSGKGIEDFRTRQYMQSCSNHYSQMILYLAVLEYNMDVKEEEIRSYLLYSKYPVLSRESHSKEHLRKILLLRNAIVAIEYAIQRKNDLEYTQSIFNRITPEKLNIAGMTGKFYDYYLRPQIDKFRMMLLALSPLEQTYFFKAYTFIVKELWLSKVGEKEYEGVKRASNLWAASFVEKLAAGELLYDLKIEDNQASSEEHFVTFAIPVYEELYLPNFRTGDAVVLYERNKDGDNVNNRQVFKGAIESLDNQRIKIRIRARQRNLDVLPEDTVYAVEHDYPDTVFNGMFASLYLYMQANQERRNLLLGQRNPDAQSLPDSFDTPDDISKVVAKAMSAKDCFLLLGPPGTGKTSLALKGMVEACLQKENNTSILLLAYTNRSVDEICKALMDISIDLPFIRIGSELNCAGAYRDRLLDRRIRHCTRRSEVKKVLSQSRVFVGTIASVILKPDLFSLKQFDIAIIDEAAQLLEPHLMGILSAKNKNGENAIKRFVLIGDHKQLPAIVLQSQNEAKTADILLMNAGITDFSNSLFERLYYRYEQVALSHAYDQLTKQGRMHPEISFFSSSFFYNGRLNIAGLEHQLTELEQECVSENEWDKLVYSSRLAFIPSRKSKKDKSDKVNHQEAEHVIAIVDAIYRRDPEHFQPETIGVITPYRNQMALIRTKLQEKGIPAFPEIMVDTVERFQGAQKDVVIYSFCLNADWQLETLPNLMFDGNCHVDRKLNVVLTRARKQLFVTGNPILLNRNPLYASLLEYIEKKSKDRSLKKALL